MPALWVNPNGNLYVAMSNDEQGAWAAATIGFSVFPDGIEHLFYMRATETEWVVMIDGVEYYQAETQGFTEYYKYYWYVQTSPQTARSFEIAAGAGCPTRGTNRQIGR